MSLSRARRPGTERIAEIAATLDSYNGFWQLIDEALSTVGLTEDYVKNFAVKSDQSKLKFIKDSVWGMMDFTRDEMALIDCPLLQRLRFIKQNGFTYLTYPSAEHSRFSHTLGVAHVVKKLLNAVNELASREREFIAGGQKYSLYSASENPELERSLVHAALLHDTGHLAFSHASEGALKAHVDRLSVGGISLTDLISIFRENQIDSELSELLSIVLCLSPRFREFYAKIESQNTDRAIHRMCCFISGVSHDPAFPGLTNIISGAVVDADKIDYINRDSMFCGIPTGIDVSRIFLNTSLVNIDEKQAEKIAQKTRQSTRSPALHPGVHFIVNSAGMDTYDEIASSKSILYHRVYLHQTTRNAERLLAECISRLCDRGSKAGAPPVDVLQYFPFNDQQLLDVLSRDSHTEAIARRLLHRNLPKRAFILFRDVCEPFIKLSDIFEEAPGRASDTGLVDKDAALRRTSAWRVWSELVPFDSIEQPERLERFRNSIREGAVKLRELTDKGFNPSILARGEPYVGLAPRFLLKPASEVLVREKNSIGRSVHWTKSEELTTAENIFKATDYIYADHEWLRYVRISTIRSIFEFGRSLRSLPIDDATEPAFDFEAAQFEVMPTVDLLLEDITSRIGIDYDEMVKEMAAAAQADFFGDAYRIVPLTRSQEESCGDIAKKFHLFSGERGWRVSHRSAINFIRQFPVNLRNQAIDLTLSGQLLSRVHFSPGIWASVKSLDEAGNKLIFCRFSPNSGNFIGMLFEQDAQDSLKKRGHEFCRNFAELDRALEADKGRTVVFVDDQFASGSQACAQLYQWSGTQRDEWPEDLRGERNIDLTEPSNRFKEFLRQGKVVLAFLYGTEDGRAAIKGVAADLKFSTVAVEFGEELPSKTSLLSPEMKSFLESVGVEILRHCRRNLVPDAKITETCKRDALGYGGKASLIVTPYNAPSHAITAFWCPGKFRDLPWVPLFLRRGYRKHLVIG